MKKIWSISTTLRNPERLRNFLITLKEMQGVVWDKKAQIEFQIRLIKNRYYGFGSTQFYNGLSQEYIDLVEGINKIISMDDARAIFESKAYESPDMRGRNSYKTLEKMGLAAIVDAKIFITSLGEYLLSDDYDLGELFFKSFLKWQYPNPVDREFSDRFTYNLKPFILTLHLIKRVNEICQDKGMKAKGISKQEFEIFVQTITHYDEMETRANLVLEFRMKLDKIREFKAKKTFIQDYKEEYLQEFSNVDNLKDYVDNTIRYFRLTRLIYIRGGGYYIDLEPRRMIEINALLDTYDGSAEEFSKEKYIKYISDINLPVLPWESVEQKQKILAIIVREIELLHKDLAIARKLDAMDENELRLYRTKLQNLKIKKELQNIDKIDETIDALLNIRDLDLKPSIALEKYITMVLNIINDAKEIKANSLVGDDNEFIFTAPANKPDIECYYDSFNAICEVTMLAGRDQWHNEGQPVMRHFRDFEEKSELEDNYCIFVAPKMHRDTINTFWFSIKYEYEGVKQKIIPLSISQIIQILEFIKALKKEDKNFTHKEFGNFLKSIINLKDEVNTSDEWLRAISKIVDNFVRKSI